METTEAGKGRGHIFQLVQTCFALTLYIQALLEVALNACCMLPLVKYFG